MIRNIVFRDFIFVLIKLYMYNVEILNVAYLVSLPKHFLKINMFSLDFGIKAWVMKLGQKSLMTKIQNLMTPAPKMWCESHICLLGRGKVK